MKLRFFFTIIFFYTTSIIYSCACDVDYSIDSIFNPINMNENYPVIFTGIYVGWDSPNLRVYKILNSFKGLEKENKSISLRSSLCNMREKVGDTVFVCAYEEGHDQQFLHFSNCFGTKVLHKSDFKLLSFFKKEQKTNDNLLSKRTKELLVLINKSLEHRTIHHNIKGELIYNQNKPEKKLEKKITNQGSYWKFVILIILMIIISIFLLKYLNNHSTHNILICTSNRS